jgi:hypothetical protein
MDVLRKHFLREGLLSKTDLTEILNEVTRIMSKFL